MTTCVLCRKHEADTRDHVPPQCLFPKPHPTLITVPSCSGCNNGAHLDDEYFRSQLVLRQQSADSPAARKLSDKVFRGLHRPAHQGLRSDILRSLRPVRVVGRDGGGRAVSAYDVDGTRVRAVLSRTVTGLYFHHYGQILPSTYVVDGWTLNSAASTDTPQFRAVVSAAQAVYHSSSRHKIGDGVFDYWFTRVDSEPGFSVWLLQFYDSLQFLLMSVPHEETSQPVT